MKRGLALVGLFAVGCASQEALPVEDHGGGIAAVRVEESPSRVVVRGLDETGAEIVAASLEVGLVPWAPDIGDAPIYIYGRKLVVHATGEPPLEHVSPGVDRLELPMPHGSPTAAALLSLSITSEVFDGVTFTTPDAAGEAGEVAFGAAYGAGNDAGCTYARGGTCGTNTCASPSGEATETQLVCCQGSHNAAQRLCTGNPGGSNSCGAVGPGGCSVCWTSSWSTSCTINEWWYYEPAYFVITVMEWT